MASVKAPAPVADTVLPMTLDGVSYSPAEFMRDVSPKHPGRWPTAYAAKCYACKAEQVAFGNVCAACGSKGLAGL